MISKVSLIRRRFSSMSPAAQHFKDLEHTYMVKHYDAFPVTIQRGEGIYLYDVDGKRYLCGASGFGAVNQGHSNPKILKAFVEQAQKITLTSRAFHNVQLGQFA